jgi:hypothetical protein
MANFFEDAWVKSGFHICPVCNKQFYIPPYVTEWRYKTKVKGYPVPVCSYSCLNKAKAGKKTELKGEYYLNSQRKRG